MKKEKINNNSILVISAHADDNIACAGTLFKLKEKGFDLFEVVLTDSGEGGDKKVRDKELLEASKFLGIKKTYKFGQEDLGLTYSKNLMLEVAKVVREVKPKIGIIMNSFDWHPDHRTAFQIGSEAFKWAATGVKPKFGGAWRTPIVLCVEGMLPAQPNILVDITKQAEKKMQLWKIYVSQAKPKAVSFDESLMSVRGYHLRRPESFMAEAFSTDPTSPIILFDEQS